MFLLTRSPQDFVFGYDNMWILAPERSGPHNWEDVGMRTALEVLHSAHRKVETIRHVLLALFRGLSTCLLATKNGSSLLDGN
eukprot:5841953-Amphidinium_carterae.1